MQRESGVLCDQLLFDLVGKWVGLPVRIRRVAVNFGEVSLVLRKKLERQIKITRLFIRHAADEPFFTSALFAGDGDKFAKLAIEHAGFFPITRHINDELENVTVLLVILR